MHTRSLPLQNAPRGATEFCSWFISTTERVRSPKVVELDKDLSSASSVAYRNLPIVDKIGRAIHSPGIPGRSHMILRYLRELSLVFFVRSRGVFL